MVNTSDAVRATYPTGIHKPLCVFPARRNTDIECVPQMTGMHIMNSFVIIKKLHTVAHSNRYRFRCKLKVSLIHDHRGSFFGKLWLAGIDSDYYYRFRKLPSITLVHILACIPPGTLLVRSVDNRPFNNASLITTTL